MGNPSMTTSSSDRHRIGIIGVGVISAVYLRTLAAHPRIDLVAVADLDMQRATAVADAHPGTVALTVDALLARDDIDTVVNLTIPRAHEEVGRRAIAHGKNVYVEKPLTATLAGASPLLAEAAARGTLVGCAPDTVLGTGIQTARHAVEAGLIGRPTAAVATWIAPGHESWHPNPEFYYLPGGGPLLDMGPYYVTSLVQLLGPVVAVTGAAGRSRDERVIGSGARAGERIPVEVATHVTGILEHAGGALSTVVMSFDGFRSAARPIEVHGEDGTLLVPDPNAFSGPVEHTARGVDGWRELDPAAGYIDADRGVGLLDMLGAAGIGPSTNRASGDMAAHVLEVMMTLLTAADEGRRLPIDSRPTLPPLVPLTAAAIWRGTE